MESSSGRPVGPAIVTASAWRSRPRAWPILSALAVDAGISRIALHCGAICRSAAAIKDATTSPAPKAAVASGSANKASSKKARGLTAVVARLNKTASKPGPGATPPERVFQTRLGGPRKASLSRLKKEDSETRQQFDHRVRQPTRSSVFDLTAFVDMSVLHDAFCQGCPRTAHPGCWLRLRKRRESIRGSQASRPSSAAEKPLPSSIAAESPTRRMSGAIRCA